MLAALTKKEEVVFTKATQPRIHKLLGSKDIDELLIIADNQRKVLLEEDSTNAYGLHAIYNIEQGDWTGQLYNYKAFTS
jgi:hypothetical protein